MKCEACGQDNQPENEFCENCGSSFGLKCENCGRINRRGSRFCGQCGTSLQSGTPQADQSSRDILRELSEKGGERKHLTVLFADIRDSTSLIDSLKDPEMGMRRLKPALDLMMDAVHRYDGIVNNVQGDGIMALFGAPRPHEDHAARGCLAALAMQDAVVRLNDPGIAIRVGLHTDEVVVQTLENSIYQTYNAAGPGVHLANRLERIADGGTIVISKETYTAARQFIEVESLGAQIIRGIAEPIEALKIVGLRNAPASGVFRSGRRLGPLIGRVEQLNVLEAELAKAAERDGRVVAIVGEAGIGKSRLCYEFTEQCRRDGIRVFETRVLAHGSATPYQPVLELLRDFFGIRSDDDTSIARQRVSERLAAIAAPKDALPLLLDFLGLADPAQPPIKLDPKGRKQALLDLVRLLASSSTSATPTVVLVEDLHWIDPASEEFVEALADAVVETKTLLIVNFRPGFSGAFTQRSHYRQISLPHLAPKDAFLLLKDQLGEDSSLGLLSRHIVERAQGNPFFLEELVNALIERGDFEGQKGAYRLKGGIDAVPLPTTVQAVIAARIDRLESLTKRVLEIASVIGREVSVAILEHVAKLTHTELSDALAKLRQAELLYELPPFSECTCSGIR